MYDITLAVSIMVVIHISVILIGMYVLRLDYGAFVGLMVGAGIVGGIVSKIVADSWKSKFQAVVKQELQEGELGRDGLMALCVLIAGTAVSGTLLYRRYGVGGWLGLLGANTAASVVV